jgi:hypothetical protein
MVVLRSKKNVSKTRSKTSLRSRANIRSRTKTNVKSKSRSRTRKFMRGGANTKINTGVKFVPASKNFAIPPADVGKVGRLTKGFETFGTSGARHKVNTGSPKKLPTNLQAFNELHPSQLMSKDRWKAMSDAASKQAKTSDITTGSMPSAFTTRKYSPEDMGWATGWTGQGQVPRPGPGKGPVTYVGALPVIKDIGRGVETPEPFATISVPTSLKNLPKVVKAVPAPAQQVAEQVAQQIQKKSAMPVVSVTPESASVKPAPASASAPASVKPAPASASAPASAPASVKPAPASALAPASVTPVVSATPKPSPAPAQEEYGFGPEINNTPTLSEFKEFKEVRPTTKYDLTFGFNPETGENIRTLSTLNTSLGNATTPSQIVSIPPIQIFEPAGLSSFVKSKKNTKQIEVGPFGFPKIEGPEEAGQFGFPKIEGQEEAGKFGFNTSGVSNPGYMPELPKTGTVNNPEYMSSGELGETQVYKQTLSKNNRVLYPPEFIYPGKPEYAISSDLNRTDYSSLAGDRNIFKKLYGYGGTGYGTLYRKSSESDESGKSGEYFNVVGAEKKPKDTGYFNVLPDNPENPEKSFTPSASNSRTNAEAAVMNKAIRNSIAFKKNINQSTYNRTKLMGINTRSSAVIEKEAKKVAKANQKRNALRSLNNLIATAQKNLGNTPPLQRSTKKSKLKLNLNNANALRQQLELNATLKQRGEEAVRKAREANAKARAANANVAERMAILERQKAELEAIQAKVKQAKAERNQ